MVIETLVVGPIQAQLLYCRLRRDTGSDRYRPGRQVNRILAGLRKNSLELKYIVNTHGHFDHVGGNKALKEAGQALILIHRGDAPLLTELSRMAAVWGMRVDEFSPAGSVFGRGRPSGFWNDLPEGHSYPGAFRRGDFPLYPKGCFCRDTLFAGSIGRFPGGGLRYPDFRGSKSVVRSRGRCRGLSRSRPGHNHRAGAPV